MFAPELSVSIEATTIVTRGGADERFNGRFRDECLSIEWFRSRREAKVIIELWRRHYNAVRPHSSLDYRTPIEFKHHHKSINQGPFPSNQWSEDPWAGHADRVPAASRALQTGSRFQASNGPEGVGVTSP